MSTNKFLTGFEFALVINPLVEKKLRQAEIGNFVTRCSVFEYRASFLTVRLRLWLLSE